MQRVSDNEYPIFRHINLFKCMAVRAMSGIAGTIDSCQENNGDWDRSITPNL